MPQQILLNPVLKFLRSPTPKGITGGGKTADKIKTSILAERRKYLSGQLHEISKQQNSNLSFSGSTHLIAKMQDDCLSPTWTPKDIFSETNKCPIVAPAYEGFLVEIAFADLDYLAAKIRASGRTNELVDISRISTLDVFDANHTLRGRSVDEFWHAGPENNTPLSFNFWLKPFRDQNARRAIVKSFKHAIEETGSRIGDPEFDISPSPTISALNEILQAYVNSGIAALSLEVQNEECLDALISSGTIYRIEPTTPLATTSHPGVGQEPLPKSIDPNSPTVVVIDGGISASSYAPLQKSLVAPLINDHYANQAHGNKVVSLICHAHAWNNNRQLPELDCTFVSAQAICKDSAPKFPTQTQLIKYFNQVAEETNQISRVWNLSFNQLARGKSGDEVSYLGHEISKIARKFGILPVISAGNTNHNSFNKRLCPPADCEAALTVSGREYENSETPLGTVSPFSLLGPAPSGMKKPDLSWYGTLRMIGGSVDHGTSFSTPLVASLAAHAFANLSAATPDLVRALLINKSDLHEHNLGLGWGTPSTADVLPWYCSPGTVTLAWTSNLRPGNDYYWHDIPVPDEMLVDGKLRGTVALTAVLKPITSESAGTNYFSTRLQTSLQAKSKSGSTISLAGSMREDKAKETLAREDLSKWSPVRNHVCSHKSKYIEPGSVKLYARVFTRDLYQFDVEHHSELDEQEVAFVLTFKTIDANPKVYDSMVSKLATDVESALTQDIHVDNDLTSS